MQTIGGQRVRIEPIRDGREAQSFQTCDVANVIAFRPAFCGGKPLPGEFCQASSRSAQRDMNRILLLRAFTGLLSRMRTFDWQIIHGHKGGGTDGRGAALDVRA
jgi:hypothetical protein